VRYAAERVAQLVYGKGILTPAGALTVDRAAKTWTLDEESCVACGTCAGVCPKDAIVM